MGDFKITLDFVLKKQGFK